MNIQTTIKRALKWLLAHIVHPIVRFFLQFSRKRYILLISHGAQIVEHLIDFREVFADDKNIKFYLYFYHGNRRHGELERSAQKMPVTLIGNTMLHLIPWHLVVMADHMQPDGIEDWNPFLLPTLRIPHGIQGKRVNGEPYAYGSKCFDAQGKIRYTHMFVYSESEKQKAVSHHAQFDSKIIVTGNLKADNMLARLKQRDEIRSQMGISQQEKLIFIASTFGENSLMQTMGEALMQQISALQKEYRIALSIHPLEFEAIDGKAPVWQAQLDALKQQGLMLLAPSDDWQNYLIACDAIVTDHTSLSMYGAGLSLPYVYAPLNENWVDDESLTWQMMLISPVLTPTADNLADCLQTALTAYPFDTQAALLKQFGTYSGLAKSRIKAAVGEILA